MTEFVVVVPKLPSKLQEPAFRGNWRLSSSITTCDQPACPRDGKPFSRRDNLLKHMQLVHGIKKKTEGSKETADEHNKRSSPENEAQQSSSSKGKREGDAVSVSSDDCSEPETQKG
jgi:hypothetical protein